MVRLDEPALPLLPVDPCRGPKSHADAIHDSPSPG